MHSHVFNRLDPDIEARVSELLGRMTLAEKIGQLNQLSPMSYMPPPPGSPRGTPPRLEPVPDVEELCAAGVVGSIFNTNRAAVVNRFQRAAVERSRLGIPLIVGGDVIHGFRTVFPIPLAMACTWNPDLVEAASRVAAEEASATGIDWIFAPMVDIARDPRWGRIAEGAGEDVYLGGAMAAAQVRGFQAMDLASGRRVAACPKHFVAYGGAEAGRDYNIVDISEITLREVYLPPFKAAFDAGAGSTMSAFNEIGGVPASGNALTLTQVLRDEWRWPGLVVSDYESVRELIPHGVAEDLKDAARIGLNTGVDMDMVSRAYATHLAELVAEGSVSTATIDEAVRRVLRLKFALGLFENPYIDESREAALQLKPDNQALALEAARQSMVLVKNEGGILPLEPGAQRLAVIGPLADSRYDPLGCWSVFGDVADSMSVLDGLRNYLGDATPSVVAGGSAPSADEVDIAAAVAAAQAADLVVLVIGEPLDLSGEAHSRAILGLPGRQQELVDAVAATGKPIVAVLMTGRPLVIPRLERQAKAILVAWHGGIRAGQAVADLLFGVASPTGRLSATWPRAEGQIPLYYAHKNTGRPATGDGTTQFVEHFRSAYLDVPNSPLFPFGFGLTYTTFSYSDLTIDSHVVSMEGTVGVQVKLTNTGQRAGTEVVQLYVRDMVGTITRPVRELKGFQRVSLEPGETRVVRFELPVSSLAFVGPDCRYRVEPGAFRLWVGAHAANGLSADFTVRAA